MEDFEDYEDYEDLTPDSNELKRKIVKNLSDNMGIMMGVFILIMAIITMTVEISITKTVDIASHLADAFLLAFLSYSMYIGCSDTGRKKGLKTIEYKCAQSELLKKKTYVIDHNLQPRFAEFCSHYIKDELVRTKTHILSCTGIEYTVYIRKYTRLTNKEIDAMQNLTNLQKKAIKEANAVRPIRLSPDMMMGGVWDRKRRHPMSSNPDDLIFMNHIVRLLFIVGTALLFPLIVLDAVFNPSWEVVTMVCMKLTTVISNGFAGYKTSRDNIVVDKVRYMEDQTNLLSQAIQFIENKEIEKSMRANAVSTVALTAPEEGTITK